MCIKEIVITSLLLVAICSNVANAMTEHSNKVNKRKRQERYEQRQAKHQEREQQRYSTNELIKAISEKNVTKAQEYLDQKANPNASKYIDDKEELLLHVALRSNQPDMVLLLLKYKALTQLRCHCDFTALHSAAQEGKVNLVKLILNYGGLVDAKAENKIPVMVSGKSPATDFLTTYAVLEKNVELSPTRELLCQALENGYVKLAARLLRAGIIPTLAGLQLVKDFYFKSQIAGDCVDSDAYKTLGRMLKVHLGMFEPVSGVARTGISQGLNAQGIPVDIQHIIAQFLHDV
ncbi:ankyrin repeat domain-containing protein [Candidatus Dependentiae bacterium]|nr:ankyrin repeat domain-containing protein [Candidatus Dependentiae bacterium]